MSAHDHLYRKLLRDTRSALFTAHNDIMTEPEGLSQTLYNWVSHIIGRIDQTLLNKPERECNQSLSVIHTILWPERFYARFEDKIVQIIRSHMDKDDFDPSLKYNQVRMWGYYWTLYRQPDTDKLMLHVRRDPDDPLTGNNSFPNKKLRQQQRSQTETLSPAAAQSRFHF